MTRYFDHLCVRALTLFCFAAMLGSCCPKQCGCDYILQDCKCVPRSNEDCVNGERNSLTCQCQCYPGWGGDSCTIPLAYLLFERGVDSTNTTSQYTTDYNLGFTAPGVYNMAGYFVTNGFIDTINISSIPPQEGTYALCASGCVFLSARFKNLPLTGVAVSGSITIDSVNSSPRYLAGMFTADLLLSDSTTYFIREGEFSLW